MRRIERAHGALVGVASATAALGVGELLAGLLGTDGPVLVVADAVVDVSPQPAKELAISLFGTYDKLVLLLGIGVVLVLAAVGVGRLALRRPRAATVVLLIPGAMGVFAVFLRRVDEPVAAVPVLAALLIAVVALTLLSRLDEPAVDAPAIGKSRADKSGAGESAMAPTEQHSAPRRLLLGGVAGTLLVGAAAGGVGRVLTSGTSVREEREAVRLPSVDHALPPLPKGSDLRIPGLSPFLTPNAEFYRIDTALSVPRMGVNEWRLRIHGMVDRPIELTYEELIERPLVEADVTLTCVSNEVGGDLVGNSRWLGVRLGDLLREAGVQSDADQVSSTSTDGWTCGTPTEAVLDDREALLAIGMDGVPLPFEHGFPVRMVVPGIYGYVSATKWVTDIELTRFADRQAYWIERGWAERGPIATMSRIDLPRRRQLSPGTHTVAGVAWAQRRGIDAVEVQLNGDPWEQAELAEVPGIDTWRQWRMDVPFEEGEHTVRVRATDGTGRTQTRRESDPLPSGATGWHTVHLSVRS